MNYKKLIVLIAGIFFAPAVFAQLIVLSGPSQGTYKKIVDDMAEVLNKDSAQILIANVETNGSGHNYNELMNPETPVKLALIQADYLFYQQMLDRKNNTNITEDINLVLPLANEQLHLVTLKGNKINHLADLEGKIVGVGNKETGTYATAEMVKNRSEVIWNSMVVHFDQALRDLFGHKIDAFFAVGTAPLKKLDINPQSMFEPLMLVSPENINDWARYAIPDVIKADYYKWLDYDVPTYSTKTLLVVNTSKLTPEDKEMILQIVNGIKENMDLLREKGHPAWKDIDLNEWNSSYWPIYNFE